MVSSSQSRREFLKCGSASLAALGIASMAHRVLGAAWETRPNIVVFMCEDVSPFLHCYGDPNGTTPTLDSFVEQSVVYTNAFTVFGVCAPSRASLWSGMSATTIGAQHMRCTAHLPAELISWPAVLRESGYETIRADKGDSQGAEKGDLWSAVGAYWWDQKPLLGWRDYDGSKPFFYQHGYGATHEGHLYHPHTDDTTPRETLPAYLPDTPTAHKMMNTMYEKYREMDDEFKMVLDALRGDGLDEDTIVIFTSDHGCGLSRMKRWPYDSGTRVPFIVRFPEKFRRPGRDLPGTTCDDLVSFVDLGPTFLHCGGVAAPSYMEGQPVFGPQCPPAREYVFTARDRIDERYDFVRSARDNRYRYVRNFMPWLPWYQWVAAAEGTRMMKELRGTHEQGTLRAEAEQFFASTRPREELYDTQHDPHEVNNLAHSEEHRSVLLRMRKAVTDHIIETRDVGFIQECEFKSLVETYGSEYAFTHRGTDNPLKKWLAFVQRTEHGESALPEMIEGLDNSDFVIRYWAALGIGNLGTAAAPAESKCAEKLTDSSPSVRIAAARALFCMGKRKQDALDLLGAQLTDANDRVQLCAANVLDSLGPDGHAVLADALEHDTVSGYPKAVCEHAGKTEFASAPFEIPPPVDSTTVSKRIGTNSMAGGKPAVSCRVGQSTLRFTVNDPAIRRIDILSMNGRVALSRNVNGSRALRVQRSEIGKGAYAVRVHRDRGSEELPAVVVR